MGRARLGVLTVLLLAGVLVGCAPLPPEVSPSAALPPAKPVGDLKTIAGVWEGTVTLRGRPSRPYRLVINEDGSWEADYEGGKPVGSMRIEGGRIHSLSKTTGLGYEFTLHESGAQRVLRGVSYEKTVTIELRPAR